MAKRDLKSDNNNVDSRLESLVEAMLNTTIGFFVSLFAWAYIVAPLYGIKSTMSLNIQITLMFTVISILRGYFVRRFFANDLHKLAHSIATNFYRNYWRKRTNEQS